MHNKRLQYTVRVSEPNPALASLLLEQFGGPDGELAAAMRYFTQGLAEDDPGRKDRITTIATSIATRITIVARAMRPPKIDRKAAVPALLIFAKSNCMAAP
ncbi:manganese catalase family protein [Sphingopyxis flava]|nr:manganese catalase family protein [Sphingopyxis flava]